MLIRDITDAAELAKNYDWVEVFGQGSGGNTDRTTEPCVPGSSIDCTPPDINEVQEIIALKDGENDEDNWVGVFLMRDGRYLVASGGCDYTGWDCQAHNDLQVAATLEDAIRFGLSGYDRQRLGFDNYGVSNDGE